MLFTQTIITISEMKFEFLSATYNILNADFS